MKWGVRNGPPYPIDRSKVTARKASAKKESQAESKTRKQTDRSGNESTDEGESSSKKRGLGKKILIGAGIGAAALVAAYAGYKLADSGNLNRLTAKADAWLHGGTPQWKTNTDLANPSLGVDALYWNVVCPINPKYGEGYLKKGTRMNCRRCTFAYELRRRGFDVEATLSRDGTGQHLGGVYNALHEDQSPLSTIGLRLRMIKEAMAGDQNGLYAFVENVPEISFDNSPLKGRGSRIFDELSKLPDRARGELKVSWRSGGSHSMAWEIVDGKPVIFDCQTHNVFKTAKEFEGKCDWVESANLLRLDNLDLNNDFLLRWVKDAAT